MALNEFGHITFYCITVSMFLSLVYFWKNYSDYCLRPQLIKTQNSLVLVTKVTYMIKCFAGLGRQLFFVSSATALFSSVWCDGHSILHPDLAKFPVLEASIGADSNFLFLSFVNLSQRTWDIQQNLIKSLCIVSFGFIIKMYLI